MSEDDNTTHDIQSPPDPQPKIFIETFSIDPARQPDTRVPEESKPEE
jgi:hypothetical protein